MLLRRSPHATVALRLLALLLVYSACRFAFYLYNHDYFAEAEGGGLARIFLGGVRFDLSAVLYVNFVYIMAALAPLGLERSRRALRALDLWFVITNSVALATNAVDFEYFRYTMRRTTSNVFAEFAHEHSFHTLLLQLAVEHWMVTLSVVALLGVSLALVTLAPHALAEASRRDVRRIAARTTVFAGVMFLVVVGCRGGFFVVSHRPIAIGNAAAYVDKPHHAALVLNTPFSLIRTITREPLVERRDFTSEDELASVYAPVHELEGRTPARRPNLVLIILESFGANAVGHLNRHLEDGTFRGYTPFLDELSERCLTFTNAHANGLHSIEALPSLIASIPTLKEQFVISPYANNRLLALPTLLATLGYDTAFFHGAPNGSMGFDAFTKHAGFARYFGQSEYGPHDSDGAWGVWDEEFLQFFAREMDGLREPFLSTVFTLTSHSPFNVPERYEATLPQGKSRAHRVMAYTDMALRRFFEAAQVKPWYRDTLFVITADHGAARTHSEYRKGPGRFRVPMLMCRESDPRMRGHDDRPAQHIDVMPTLLDYAGFEGELVAFGRDLLDERAQRFAVNQHPNGPYELVEGDYVLELDGERPESLYRYRADRELTRNLLSDEPEVARAMERRLRAIIQQYNNRMREDRLAPGRSR